MKRYIGSIAVSGAALTALALGVQPASAQTASIGGLTLGAANGTSTGQAGYFVTKAPASASASEKFTVPKLTCTSTLSGIAIGSLIFTGSGATASFTAAALFAECSGGAPAYAAIVAVNGSATQGTFTPAVGDVIKVSVSGSKTAAKATVTDVTKSKHVSASAATGATNALVLDGIDSLVNNAGTQLAIPNFGKEKFKVGMEDGKTVMAAGGVPVDLKTSAGVLKIHTGALNTAGNVWKEIFKHS